MQTQPTPGPWRYCKTNGSPTHGQHMIAGAKPGYLAEVLDCGSGDVGDNARLIASAPDLLEALQWYEAKAVQMGRAAIDKDSKLLLELMKEVAVEYGAQARAAIARATGEQP